MSDVVIQATNLSVDVQSKKILKNISFQVHKGEVLALLGGVITHGQAASLGKKEESLFTASSYQSWSPWGGLSDYSR
ncbi:MAG: hypothetical protein VYC51_05580, partial [Pseudomonadota bacterium]|nr:hypothetical protein [Pseudomonadota bacterium]